MYRAIETKYDLEYSDILSCFKMVTFGPDLGSEFNQFLDGSNFDMCDPDVFAELERFVFGWLVSEEPSI